MSLDHPTLNPETNVVLSGALLLFCGKRADFLPKIFRPRFPIFTEGGEVISEFRNRKSAVVGARARPGPAPRGRTNKIPTEHGGPKAWEGTVFLIFLWKNGK